MRGRRPPRFTALGRKYLIQKILFGLETGLTAAAAAAAAASVMCASIGTVA
jgi:hypothetical protein